MDWSWRVSRLSQPASHASALQLIVVSHLDPAMPGTRRKADPLLYPPLTPALKARMRTAGHADMVELLDRVSASTIRGLVKAAASGPVFKPKVARKAA